VRALASWCHEQRQSSSSPATPGHCWWFAERHDRKCNS
jgi:hypothetical protein